MEYIYITLALIFTSSGQLFQKIAADKATIKNSDSLLNDFLSFKETWFAVICLVTGMIFWLAVLYLMDVGTAYPFLSINLILVMLVSHFILKENITTSRITGAIYILIGVILVTAS